MGLARLALASRKFPEAGQMDAVLPACDEKCAVAFDDGGGDDDVRLHANEEGRFTPRRRVVDAPRTTSSARQRTACA